MTTAAPQRSVTEEMQDQVLACMAEGPRGIQDVADELGVPYNRVYRAVHTLAEAGQLELTGQDPEHGNRNLYRVKGRRRRPAPGPAEVRGRGGIVPAVPEPFEGSIPLGATLVVQEVTIRREGDTDLFYLTLHSDEVGDVHVSLDR